MTLSGEVARAYSASGESWQRGAAPIYDRLAAVLVECCPIDVTGQLVLDVGAGTGAASRAAAAAGARVIAVDVAAGMLAVDAATRPPAAVGDVVALPFADSSVDAAIAAFSLNHLVAPRAGFAELARVTRPSGGVVVSAYRHDDAHPVKAAVERAVTEHGWRSADWNDALRELAIPQLATEDRMLAAADVPGLADISVHAIDVPFPELGAAQLVDWRLAMPAQAEFLATLPAERCRDVRARAMELLGDAPALVRSVLVLTART